MVCEPSTPFDTPGSILASLCRPRHRLLTYTGFFGQITRYRRYTPPALQARDRYAAPTRELRHCLDLDSLRRLGLRSRKGRRGRNAKMYRHSHCADAGIGELPHERGSGRGHQCGHNRHHGDGAANHKSKAEWLRFSRSCNNTWIQHKWDCHRVVRSIWQFLLYKTPSTRPEPQRGYAQILLQKQISLRACASAVLIANI
jgi:hypothetical protein